MVVTQFYGGDLQGGGDGEQEEVGDGQGNTVSWTLLVTTRPYGPSTGQKLIVRTSLVFQETGFFSTPARR